MMDCKKCNDCIYYRCYYHGEAKFSHECLWALKDPCNVDESDCHKVIDQMVEEERQYKLQRH